VEQPTGRQQATTEEGEPMEELQALARNGRTDWGTYDEVPGRGVTSEDGVTSKDGLAVSEEEYWKKYYHDPDFIYEWNNGQLEVRPMSDQKGSETYQWFCGIMHCYIRTHPVGRMTNLEIGFRLALPHKVVVRVPDLAVVLDGNPAGLDDDDCTYGGIFDLCVESLSHSSHDQVVRDTVEKRDEYAWGGVGEYHIIDARGIETAFHRLDRRGMYVPIPPTAEGVIRSTVLPGFQFRVSDLYTRPSLETLAEDGVYHDYVFPSHKEVRRQAERETERAERETERAERETERAEQAELRAEQEARLRERAERQFTETARNMLSNGLETALIMKYTGLSADELAALSGTGARV